MADGDVLDIMAESPKTKPIKKLKVGDKVMVDGQRCEVIKLGEKTDSVHVRALDPPSKGKRFVTGCVFTEGLAKP